MEESPEAAEDPQTSCRTANNQTAISWEEAPTTVGADTAGEDK